MDASLSSPAAWSQNTEVLVKRWLIFPNGAVHCKQDFGHHVFISLDQNPYYLRLGNRSFVIRQRARGPFEQVSTEWRPVGKIVETQLPRTHRERIKAGVWSRAPLLRSIPADVWLWYNWVDTKHSWHFLASRVTPYDSKDWNSLGNVFF